MNQVDLIICGDLHLSDTIPKCRTDNYFEAQWKKIAYIDKLCQVYDCHAVFPGDICDKPKLSPWVERTAIEKMPPFIGVPGQHDLPYHNINNYLESSLSVIEQGCQGECVVLEPFTDGTSSIHIRTTQGNNLLIKGEYWGCGELDKPEKDSIVNRNILIKHSMVWTGTTPYPGCEADSVHKVLLNRPEYDLIITGDNHKHVKAESKGRILINCGSVMRMSSDQVDHRPCVYLYNAEYNEVERIEIPVRKGVISREHIEEDIQREQQKKALIRNLKSNSRPSLNFKNNLKEAVKDLDKEVKEVVEQSLIKE